MPARLEVITGPMFSGKTEELIRRIKREQYAHRTVQVLKPVVDTRTTDYIAARAILNGKHEVVQRMPAIVIRTPQDLKQALSTRYDLLVIDEGQFMDVQSPTAIEQYLHRYQAESLRVIISGLDLDYRREPFGPMPLFLAMADDITKLSGVCMQCGSPEGRFTQRMSGGSKQILVGSENYQVRCRACHTIP